MSMYELDLNTGMYMYFLLPYCKYFNLGDVNIPAGWAFCKYRWRKKLYTSKEKMYHSNISTKVRISNRKTTKMFSFLDFFHTQDVWEVEIQNLRYLGNIFPLFFLIINFENFKSSVKVFQKGPKCTSTNITSL